MSIYGKKWDDERQVYVSGRKVGRPLGPNAPHYPNKAEARLLRKMMQDGQCSEEEVRSRKGNRQKLAAAASEPMQKGTTDRHRLRLKQRAKTLAARESIPLWEAQAKVGL